MLLLQYNMPVQSVQLALQYRRLHHLSSRQYRDVRQGGHAADGFE
jgi:hypothetical protein